MTTFACIKCEDSFEVEVSKALLLFTKPRYCFKCVHIEQENYNKLKLEEELTARISTSGIGFSGIEQAKKANWTFLWQTRALEFVKKYSWTPQQKLPYFWGGVGTGKTHIAIMLAYKMMKELQMAVLFSPTAELIRDSIENKHRFNQFKQAYHPVIIDDLGNHSVTQWTIEKIYDLINHRLINNLPTAFTSNFNPIELETRFITGAKETVDNIICKSITDRLLELCKPIKVNGESVRKLMFKESIKKEKK